jgi:hypothetical protein
METADGLGNEAQKRDYILHATSLSNGLQRSAMAHQASQIPAYQNSVARGLIDTHVNTIGLNPMDTQGNNTRIQSIYEQNRIIARNSDKSQDEADATSFGIVSKAHRAAISGLIESNQYGQAEQYAQTHHDSFVPDDRNAVTRMIQNRQVAVGADAIAHDVIASNAPATDVDRAHNITFQTESSSRHFRSDGQIITSPDGAKGIAQIMPTTGPEAAKAAGVKWDPELFNRTMTGDKVKDQEAIDYSVKLGNALFDKYTQKYGSFDKAWAAYNAGEGKSSTTGYDKDGKELPGLQPAIARANAKGTDWRTELPRETQEYVAKNTKAFNEGKGQPSQMTLKETMDNAEAKFRTSYPALADNPDNIQQVRSVASSKYQQNKTDTLQREDQSLSDAYNWGDKNGWNWGKMPDTIKQNIPTDKRLSLESVFSKQGQVVTDLATLGHFKMKSQAELAEYTPESFLSEYHDKLSPSDLHSGLDVIKAAKNNDPQSAAFLSTQERVKSAAQSSAIIPRDRQASEEEATNYQHFSETVNNRIIQTEAMNGGKKLDRAGIDKIIHDIQVDRAYTDKFGFDSNKLISSMNETELKNAYVKVPVLEDGAGVSKEIYLRDIPAEKQAELVKQLVSMNVPVTSDNIARAWLLQKGVKLNG